LSQLETAKLPYSPSNRFKIRIRNSSRHIRYSGVLFLWVVSHFEANTKPLYCMKAEDKQLAQKEHGGSNEKNKLRNTRELRVARIIWGRLSPTLEHSLLHILASHRLSLSRGDLVLLNGNWYITHAGLLRIAARKHCLGMRVMPIMKLCDVRSSQYVFRATVYKSAACKGFTGYGDANPSNVSPVVRGAELRVAETRAVNRALRKAYGVGLCSVEEIGSCTVSGQATRRQRLMPSEC
jgi:hypothetical protein